MKNNNTIKIKNDLPELIAAVCNHEDCPEWLRVGIWDFINDKGGAVIYTANYFRAALESVDVSQQWEKERRLGIEEFTEVENDRAN